MRAWILAAAVAALVACRDSGGSGPTEAQLKGDPPGPGTDSAGKPLPASVDASGQVVAVERLWPPAANGDTLRRTPVPGTAVSLWRTPTASGSPGPELLRQTTTDAGGSWRFDDIAGGYYELRVVPPLSSGLRPAAYHLAATSASVVLLVQLWRPEPGE